MVLGYGWRRLRSLAARRGGADVVVTEIDPLKALEATMDGYRVMPSLDAARIGDFFCTVTGNCEVLAQPHFERMKDGAIVANSGHFNVEIDIAWLEKNGKKRTVRDFLDEYTLKSGTVPRWREGRRSTRPPPKAIPAGDDMSFTQPAQAEYVVKNARSWRRRCTGAGGDRREIARPAEELGVRIIADARRSNDLAWEEGHRETACPSGKPRSRVVQRPRRFLPISRAVTSPCSGWLGDPGLVPDVVHQHARGSLLIF